MSEDEFLNKDEGEILASIQRGDKDVFAGLYRQHFIPLCQFAFYLTKDDQVAKEVVQDTFLAVWEHRTTWQPSGTIRSYFYKAVKNRSLDFLKHKKVVQNWEKTSRVLPPESEEDEDKLTGAQLAAAIEKEIEKLPEKQRMIFVMSRQQGLTYAEIADILGLSVKTVETQMGRAFRKLRSSLKDYL